MSEDTTHYRYHFNTNDAIQDIDHLYCMRIHLHVIDISMHRDSEELPPTNGYRHFKPLDTGSGTIGLREGTEHSFTIWSFDTGEISWK